jgi:hypothetical protein
MPGHGNGEDVGSNFERPCALKNAGREARGRPIGFVNPHPRAEGLRIALGVGDVVAMGEQNMREPAPPGERFDDCARPARRIDHGVAALAPDQEGVSAI